MNFDTLNDMMTAPLQILVDLPQVVKMTIRLKPGMAKGHLWDCDITVERYDNPTRFYVEAAPADEDRAADFDFDTPLQAYATPQDAFWAAVAFIGDQIKPITPA